MKKFFILFFPLTLFYPGFAQQGNTVVINPVKQNEQEIIKSMYQYPQFTAGRAFNKDGSVAESKFNYSYLTNQISFIAPGGDTLQLINGPTFNKIVITSDTFFYYNKLFVQQITHHSSFNLYVKRTLQNNGLEKKGAYDTYSGTSSITSVNSIIDNRVGNVKLAADVNITYIFKDLYYVSGKYGQLYPANKKGIYEVFSKNEKQIKEFIEKNQINYSKKEDLEKLLEYARTIVK